MNALKRAAKKYVIPHKDNDFRPYFLRAAGVILALAFILIVFFASHVQRLMVQTSGYLATILPAVLADLANSDRQSYSLGTLEQNELLQIAAKMKAEDMAAKGYFSHNSPEGVTPWYWITKSGYKFSYAGENLAIYFDDSQAVHSAWMNSPSHKANILDSRFKEIGIATAKGLYEGRETFFVVQMFGTPPVQVATAPAVQVIEKTIQKEEPKSEIAVSKSEPTTSPANDSSEISLVLGESSQPTSSAQFSLTQDEKTTFLQKVATSPTKSLGLVYATLSVLLILFLFVIAAVKHELRLRHSLIIILLLVMIAGLYFAFRNYTMSEVHILVSNVPVSI